jgi:hypothetical protein
VTEDSSHIQRNFKNPEHAQKYAWLWLKSIERKISEGSTEDFGPWIKDLKRLHDSPEKLMEVGEANELVLRHIDRLAMSSFVTDFAGACGEAPQRVKDCPPSAAEFLFYVFLTPANCDALVGDLEERYKIIRKRFGARRANFWYLVQVITSVGPIVWAATKRLLKAVSGLAVLVDVWRRLRS